MLPKVQRYAQKACIVGKLRVMIVHRGKTKMAFQLALTLFSESSVPRYQDGDVFASFFFFS